MIIRIVIALVVSAMMHFALGCGGDPCLDADYTTSGLCVHLDGHDLVQDDVDFVVQIVSQVARQHGMKQIDMEQLLNEIGPVPLVMVPYGSLGRDSNGVLVAGCVNYLTFSEWDNMRLGGYTVRMMTGMDLEQELLTLAHELLHIMGPEYLGTTHQINADHAEPYMFRNWGIYYDRSYSPRHTVEGVSWTYIQDYLGLEQDDV